MNMPELRYYDKELGIDGTLKELVDWANRYTADYSDEALRKISEYAVQEKAEEKYIKIPLLLIEERLRDNTDIVRDTVPYERMKIDYYLYDSTSFSRSLYGPDDAELEIWSEGSDVIISLIGTDAEGSYTAAGKYSVEEFMQGEGDWLESQIGQILYYGKEYDERSKEESEPVSRDRLEDMLIDAFEWAINVSEQVTEDLIRATGITSEELTSIGYDRENFPKMHECIR